MRLAVVGGKLQGTEAAYLGRKAGFDVVLVDRRPGVPASGLAAETHCFDVLADEERARRLFLGCDAVLPACEEDDTLEWLDARVRAWGVPLLFDLDAYRVSSSKLRSNRLFAELDVPRPQPFPACGFPLVVKPSTASGSEGVRVVEDENGLREARAALEAAGHEVVVEEFAPGASLSLEVIAWKDQVAVLTPTLLEFDRFFDCKRVLAPVEDVDAAVVDEFGEVCAQLARGLGLRGLMDIEAMVHGGRPKVLEIDARLPSQTPTAVYHSSGVNMLDVLAQTVLHDRIPAVDAAPRRGCSFQHVAAADGVLEVLGEHVIGGARPLRLEYGFFGADEALTDFAEDRDDWVATLITLGDTAVAARERAAAAVQALAAARGLRVAPESSAMPGDECR